MWSIISFAFEVLTVKPRVKSKMNVTRNAASVVFVLLIQLPVHSADMQVATHKPASQSTTLFDANRAVDGSEGDASMNGCSHTAAGQNTAWWRVDLEKPYFIKRILIYPRPTDLDEFRGNFAGFSLAVSEHEETGYHDCFDYGKNNSLPNLLMTHSVNCTPPANGRYVRISNNRDDGPYGVGYSHDAYVNLCEVEIFVEDCHENCIDCVCSACKNTFYGDKCNKSCSVHCGGEGLCNQTDGRCNNHSCKSGYYGTKCNFACSSHCVDNSCNFSTGYCDKCNGSFYGINCNDTCLLNCASCQSASECSECKKGYYGNICGQNCLNCGMEVCEKEGGKCVNELCKAGYFTPYCNQSCSGNCKGNSSCGFLNGLCNTCPDGFYGVHCELQCIHGCKSCSNSTGCTECSYGLYGTMCDRTCPPCGGDASCNINSGFCNSNTCRPGFYGDGKKCDRNCSNTCGSDGSCDVRNGTCLFGCQSGFSGQICDRRCPENCVACDQMTRKCIHHGCNVGYHGSFCSSACPKNCGGKGECSIIEGFCTNGCNDGWEGFICMNQAAKSKSSEMADAAIGGTIGGFSLVVLGVLIMFLVVRRYRRARKRNESSTYMSTLKPPENHEYASMETPRDVPASSQSSVDGPGGKDTNGYNLYENGMNREEAVYYNTILKN